MHNLNRATILGNLTRDPEVKTTSGNQTVASFSVATTRKWKDQATSEMKEATEFHNCVAWGKLAEIIQQYVHKGDKLYVEGYLKTRSWDDPTGVKKYRTEIVAENVIMLNTKRTAGDATAAPENAPAEDLPNPEDIPF